MDEMKMVAEFGAVLSVFYLLIKFTIEREKKVMEHLFNEWNSWAVYTNERMRKVDDFLITKKKEEEK
jgi:hypothetical protein